MFNLNILLFERNYNHNFLQKGQNPNQSTHYINLYEQGDYSYSINDDDDDGIFLEFTGLDKSIYIAPDIPFTDNATGSHYVIDDLLTFFYE